MSSVILFIVYFPDLNQSRSSPLGLVFRLSYAAGLATRRSVFAIWILNFINSCVGASKRQRLTFAELEAFASLGLAGFLALDHTGVAHEETFFLQSRTVLDVVLAECAGDSHAQSLSLAGDSTAIEIGLDIPFAFSVGNLQGLVDDVLQRASGEIFLIVSFVNNNLAGAGGHIDAGNGAFSSTNGVDYFHIVYYLTSLILITLGF